MSSALRTLRPAYAVLVAVGALTGCKRDVSRTVYALQYGHSQFDERYLIEGGQARNVDFGWFCFFVDAGPNKVLVDTGYIDPAAGQRFAVAGHTRVDARLAALSVGTDAVTDIVLTHGHWDHAGGLSLFGRATVWMSRAELNTMRAEVSAARPRNNGYLYADLQTLDGLQTQGRLRLIDRPTQISAGLRIVPVGGHTPGSLAVVVGKPGAPRVVLAGDNAYLQRNISERRAISKAARRGGADAMPTLRQLAGDSALLVPGHDPVLMTRFFKVTDGVARLHP